MALTKNDPRKINLLRLSTIFLVVIINKGQAGLPINTNSCCMKHEEDISALQMELKSVKTQSERFENRLNEIENRFAHSEGRQRRPAISKGYDNDDYYTYEEDYKYPQNY